MKQLTLSWALGLALACALFLDSCAVEGQRKASAEAAPTTVTVVEVQPRDIPIFSDISAQTYARHAVEVRGRVEGYIEKWLFKPGAEVRAGDVLYVLDLRPYEAALEQAKGNLAQSEADLEFARRQVSLQQAEANLESAQANLVKAQQDFERLQPLVKADAAPQQDLDAAVAAQKAHKADVDANTANVKQTTLSTRTQIMAMGGKVEALKAAVRTAELNLQYGTIRAPISGRIGDTLIPVGGLVTPNSPLPLTTIVPPDPMWVRFKATESEYISWTKRGEHTPGASLPLTLILADNSEYPWKGHVENTLNQVDMKTGTLELQASFPNPSHTLLAGQFGRVRVEVEERKGALVVPQKAVLQLQSMLTVYAVGADNKVVARPIITGPRSGESWIVEQGLAAGDRVIVEGLLRVRPGALVTPQPCQGK